MSHSYNLLLLTRNKRILLPKHILQTLYLINMVLCLRLQLLVQAFRLQQLLQSILVLFCKAVSVLKHFVDVTLSLSQNFSNFQLHVSFGDLQTSFFRLFNVLKLLSNVFKALLNFLNCFLVFLDLFLMLFC